MSTGSTLGARGNKARRPRATIRDVAARAGCSPSTVSRVLNGVGRSSQETKDRVAAAAKALSFRFDPIGRSLQSRRSRMLGLMVPTLAHPVFAEAASGAQAAANARGYQLLLACSNEDPAQEKEGVATLIAHRVDGLILALGSASKSQSVALLHEADVPFVLFANDPADPPPTLTIDDRAAAERVAAEMMALGHVETAFVAGQLRRTDGAMERYDGFKAAFVAAGHPAPELVEVDASALSHRAQLSRLRAHRPGVSALFCANDTVALTVIGTLGGLGHSVPEDISVVGFAGTHLTGNLAGVDLTGTDLTGTDFAATDLAAIAQPSVATITANHAETGARAAARLIALIEGSEPPPELLERSPLQFRAGASLGRPPASAPKQARAKRVSNLVMR